MECKIKWRIKCKEVMTIAEIRVMVNAWDGERDLVRGNFNAKTTSGLGPSLF